MHGLPVSKGTILEKRNDPIRVGVALGKMGKRGMGMKTTTDRLRLEVRGAGGGVATDSYRFCSSSFCRSAISSLDTSLAPFRSPFSFL